MGNVSNVAAEPRAVHAITPLEYAHQDNGQMMRFVVNYDSMSPTIKIGDMVAVETSITWWVKDGIYLLNFPRISDACPGTQLLRRVIRIPFQDRYKIICDHQDYETVEVDGNLLDIAGLAVEALSHKQL